MYFYFVHLKFKNLSANHFFWRYILFSTFSVNDLAQATLCWRYQHTDDELAFLSAHQRNQCLENRDSMGLLAAIFTGREVKARELLALPWTNINAQYANGNTPLILAVQGMIIVSVKS